MTVASWNMQPPPGFQGLRKDLPLHVYWRHLPHWRQDGATYFVTFRLGDSLPQSKLRELDAMKREWIRQHSIRRTDCQSVCPFETDCQSVLPKETDYQSVLPKETDYQSVLPKKTDCQSVLRRQMPDEQWETFSRAVMVKVERWLDEGMGQCWLARPEAAAIVTQALHYFDDDQYELGCYVLMPNHIHAILHPLRWDAWPLEKILQSRKRRTSREFNSVVVRNGTLWQEESFDRIIRDEEHLYRCIQYIGANPAKARMPPELWQRWLRPSWEAAGWKFDN